MNPWGRTVTTYCNRNEIYVFRQLWKPYIELFKVKNSIIRHRRHHPHRGAGPAARSDHVHRPPPALARPSPPLAAGAYPPECQERNKKEFLQKVTMATKKFVQNLMPLTGLENIAMMFYNKK